MKIQTTIKTISMLLFALSSTTNAAVLAGGYTTGSGSQLLNSNGGSGSVLFNDSAALGGNQDPSGTGATFFSVLLDGSSSWNVGETVTITGLAMALRGATANGTFTFDIRQGSGGTGASGTAGLASLGTQDATFSSNGTTSTYFVNFDTPISFVADANSTSIVVNWGSTGNIAWKSESATGAGRLRQVNYSNGNFSGTSSVRFSVAGNVSQAIPEPSTAVLAILGGLALLRRRR
ncbi:MAG: hypothetical protein AB8D78_13395 [Akkermansiaceae bacterium]